MDANRFDTLIRSLTVAGSRRRALTALAASFGLLGLAYADDADAATSGRCKPRCGECQRCKRGDCRKRKNRKRRCNRGKCQPVATGTPCTRGTCCNGNCVNTRANEANCGGCGVACPPGLNCCHGICTNQQTDPANCGRCGQVCPAAAPVCRAGVCIVGP